MDSEEDILQQKMREFISKTCNFHKRPVKEIREFHKQFFKFYFNAVDVNIDYQAQTISIWNSRPVTTNPVRLFDLNDAIADTVSYTDLEETLLGCVENGHLQNTFYKKILMEFSYFFSKDSDILSA